MKTYTIIAGVNGVGKSSLSGVLKAERSDLGYVVDVDKIAVENHGNVLCAGRIAIAKIEQSLSKGLSFSQETTLSGYLVERNARVAKERGYKIRMFYIGLDSAEESVKRIKNRVEKGGHNIDSIDVDRRYNKRFQDLYKILPYCDEVYLYDNENGFVEVGEYKNGELIVKGNYKPRWLCELEKFVSTSRTQLNK